MHPDPAAPPPVPEIVVGLARGRPVHPVWRNEIGGVTFQLGNGAGREFVKWQPHHPEADPTGEAARLRWAGRWITVPEVLGTGADAAGGWLHTRGIVGDSAVSARFAARPQVAARAVGAGLRALHDALPVARCPFDWSPASRLRRVRPRLARELAAGLPPDDLLVVCHGDACAPNTLIGPNDRWSGHVDLDQLGVADRWADLAVAAASLGWNFAGDHEATFFAAYGVAPDRERMAFYRRLWDAG